MVASVFWCERVFFLSTSYKLSRNRHEDHPHELPQCPSPPESVCQDITSGEFDLPCIFGMRVRWHAFSLPSPSHRHPFRSLLKTLEDLSAVSFGALLQSVRTLLRTSVLFRPAARFRCARSCWDNRAALETCVQLVSRGRRRCFFRSSGIVGNGVVLRNGCLFYISFLYCIWRRCTAAHCYRCSKIGCLTSLVTISTNHCSYCSRKQSGVTFNSAFPNFFFLYCLLL